MNNLYQERIDRFAKEEQTCIQQNSRYAWLRLLFILLAVISGIYFYSIATWASIVAVILFIVLFAICLKKHLSNIDRQHQKEYLKRINQQELACLSGDYSSYDPGEQYQDPKHDYTSDLDIFGSYSLFRYLNRTTSPSGSDMLAQWLKKPASTQEIRNRQEAVTELSEMIDWRQDMQAIGYKHKAPNKELPDFIKWLATDPVLLSHKKMRFVTKWLPYLTIPVIIAACFGIIPSSIPWLFVIVHFAISGSVFKQVNMLHQQISRKVDFIGTYSGLIRLLTETNFSSAYMSDICRCFDEDNALLQIESLKNRIKRLDNRLNLYYFPVNLLLFADYKHLIWLEQWRINHKNNVIKWFEAIAQAEAIISLSNAKFNHPDWAMPEITDEYFVFDAENLGHPLIPEKERICNNFSTSGKGQIAVVTGSNMSGKSTFQRSIGFNMVLALAGAPVCATHLKIANCHLYTYMRISDNLDEQTSSFYAELKRLKQLIDTIQTGESVFFLLDEILRGTNSMDRKTGSMALIKQLAHLQVSGVIATHDLALGELEKELPQQISNYHFDVQISGEDMSFDYKLHPGICTSMNASILMRKIGIKVL